MRLNKYLAQARGISRRQADTLITLGVVSVNGEPAQLGVPVNEGDVVTVNGKDEQLQQYKYVLFHKPIGYVSSRRAQGDTPTIYHLLSNDMHQLKPVGRLDKDSSGLMLLTNDGDYTHTLLHPSFGKQKQYIVVLDMPLTEADRRHIISGVDLQDGISKLSISGADNRWKIEMYEGRNRQIRRTFARLGYTVTKLHRTHFGAYTIDGLKPGEAKYIDKIEE